MTGRTGYLAALAATALLAAAPARAALITTFSNTTLSSTPVTASFGGGVGTLSFTAATVTGVGPGAAVATGGTAMVTTIFGGLADYEPGTVFDGTASYASFSTATTIPNSPADDYIGFTYTGTDGTHLGYAEVNGSTLVGYAYQSVAGDSITGSTLTTAVPEPATMTLLLGSLAGVGLIRRNRAKR